MGAFTLVASLIIGLENAITLAVIMTEAFLVLGHFLVLTRLRLPEKKEDLVKNLLFFQIDIMTPVVAVAWMQF